MSEEEKKAIDYTKARIYGNEELENITIYMEDLITILNLIEKQDKIIDLMADYIHLYTLSGEEDVYCFKVNDCEVVGGSKSCFDCIKEHFRKKVKTNE